MSLGGLVEQAKERYPITRRQTAGLLIILVIVSVVVVAVNIEKSPHSEVYIKTPADGTIAPHGYRETSGTAGYCQASVYVKQANGGVANITVMKNGEQITQLHKLDGFDRLTAMWIGDGSSRRVGERVQMDVGDTITIKRDGEVSKSYTFERDYLLVGDQPCADYSSLSNAVANASPSDTIALSKGTYEGGITINKPLTIEATANHEDVVVKPRKGYAFRATGESIRLYGFTVDVSDGGTAIIDDTARGSYVNDGIYVVGADGE